MAITAVGGFGTSSSGTSTTTLTHNTSQTIGSAVGVAMLWVVSDNIATADGNTTDHQSITGGVGTWTKLGEYTNTVGGAAADGVTVSLWKYQQSSGSSEAAFNATITFSAAVVDKCAIGWRFAVTSGNTLSLDTEASPNPSPNGTDGSNDFGSVAFSSLSSQERLYIRALGKEANTTTAITVSTNFTNTTVVRSRNNAAAVIARGEFRINTSTGETSNPTLAVSGDTAGLFAALEEVSASTPYSADLSAPDFDFTGRALTLFYDFVAQLSAPAFAFTGRTLTVLFDYAAQLSAPVFSFVPRSIEAGILYIASLSAPAFNYVAEALTVLTDVVVQFTAPAFQMVAQSLTRFNAFVAQVTAASFRFTANVLTMTYGEIVAATRTWLHNKVKARRARR